MREHLGFLKVSSAVVKIAAWIFLFLGGISGIAIILRRVPGYSVWVGVGTLVVYIFFFFLFYLIAKIADLLIRIINEIKKE